MDDYPATWAKATNAEGTAMALGYVGTMFLIAWWLDRLQKERQNQGRGR